MSICIIHTGKVPLGQGSGAPHIAPGAYIVRGFHEGVVTGRATTAKGVALCTVQNRTEPVVSIKQAKNLGWQGAGLRIYE